MDVFKHPFRVGVEEPLGRWHLSHQLVGSDFWWLYFFKRFVHERKINSLYPVIPIK